jgi:hypothetical protein
MFKFNLSLGGVKSTEKLQFSFLFQIGSKNTKEITQLMAVFMQRV